MLRPSLIACPECACHVRAVDTACPHCDAPLFVKAPSGESRSLRRAAVAVSLGLAVSVASLAACDDGPGTGGTGGKSSMMGSDSSAIATYGVGSSVSVGPTGATSGTGAGSTGSAGTGSTGTGN